MQLLCPLLFVLIFVEYIVYDPIKASLYRKVLGELIT